MRKKCPNCKEWMGTNDVKHFDLISHLYFCNEVCAEAYKTKDGRKENDTWIPKDVYGLQFCTLNAIALPPRMAPFVSGVYDEQKGRFLWQARIVEFPDEEGLV